MFFRKITESAREAKDAVLTAEAPKSVACSQSSWPRGIQERAIAEAVAKN